MEVTPAPSAAATLNESQRWGYIEGWVSVVLNTALFAVKYWVGISIGSISMVADAWHTLSDTLTSIVVIVGFWITTRPADEAHPFGHARAEGIAAVVIGVLLAVVGGSFLLESVKRLLHQQPAAFSTLAIIVFLVSMVAKEALAQFAFRIGRKTGASSVTADGWHHRSDAIASGLIVLGVWFGKSLWWMDGALGIGVSGLILWAAVDIVRDASSSLLGEAPDPEVEKRIVTAIHEECPAVTDVHHLHMHRYGPRIELTLHVRLSPAMRVDEAHSISQRIESRLRRDQGMEATVHIEPMK